jgi:hypothetical protein
MSDENPKLFPAWKQAVRTLLDGGLTYGSVLKRSYISTLCEVPPPVDIKDVRRYDLELLRCITEIKDILLTAHCMLMVSDHAGNYIIIEPESQTQHAVDIGVRAIGREMKRMAMGVSFTKTELLTDEGRKKNADAQAKISQIAGMLTLEKRELQQIADRSQP